MRESIHTPKTPEDLKEFLRGLVQSTDRIALHAGHFLVYYDRTEDLLLPCVASELNGPRQGVIAEYVGRFPELTWRLGLELLGSLAALRKYVFVLVNDWQYVPPGIDRNRFYADFQALPDSFSQLLSTSPDIALLSPPRMRKGLFTGAFFSEQTLRNQFRRHVKEMITKNQLPTEVFWDEKNRELSCSLMDNAGSHQEIYCEGKRESCTQEVAELVHRVAIATECNVLVNIFPIVCRDFVDAGTDLAINFFQVPVRNVVNIGMQATGVENIQDLFRGCMMSIHTDNKRECYV